MPAKLHTIAMETQPPLARVFRKVIGTAEAFRRKV